MYAFGHAVTCFHCIDVLKQPVFNAATIQVHWVYRIRMDAKDETASVHDIKDDAMPSIRPLMDVLTQF